VFFAGLGGNPTRRKQEHQTDSTMSCIVHTNTSPAILFWFPGAQPAILERRSSRFSGRLVDSLVIVRSSGPGGDSFVVCNNAVVHVPTVFRVAYSYLCEK